MRDTYSIYEAKAKLSQLLRRVKEGWEVIIAERGTPIAKVVPLQKQSSFEERLDYLTAIHAILPAKRKEIPKGVKRLGGLARFLKGRE